jgi:hypothetical protein
MVISRNCALQPAAVESQWLCLSSSRWKLFLRHMELPHPACPSPTLPHQLEGRNDGAANRGGGAACAEFAESRAASATMGGTTKHHDPS